MNQRRASEWPVNDIVRHADHRQPWLWRIPQPPLHALPDRILAGPEGIRQTLVDDRDVPVLALLVAVEGAPGDERDSIGAEVFPMRPRHGEALRLDRRAVLGGKRAPLSIRIERKSLAIETARTPGKARSRSSSV